MLFDPFLAVNSAIATAMAKKVCASAACADETAGGK